MLWQPGLEVLPWPDVGKSKNKDWSRTIRTFGILIFILFILFYSQLGVTAMSCRQLFQDPIKIQIRKAVTQRKKDQNQSFRPLVETWSRTLKKQMKNKVMIKKIYREEAAQLRIGSYEEFFKYFENQKVGLRREDQKTPFVERLPNDLYWFMRDAAFGNILPRRMTGDFVGRYYFYWRADFLEHPAFSHQGLPIIAIGKGNPKYYRDLMLTTMVAMRLMYEGRKEFSEILGRIDSSDVPFARRNNDMKISWALTALLESQVSISQFISLLTFHKLPGLSRLELTEKILTRSDLIGGTPLSAFTRLLPLGLTGPLHSRGHFFSSPPLKLNSRGEVVPTKKFINTLRTIREDREKQLTIDESGKLASVESCRGCPLTMREQPNQHSGIDRLAESFLNLYKFILNQNSD